MKILHITPRYIPAWNHGGPVKSVHEVCRELVKKGVKISVFTSNADDPVGVLKVPVETTQLLDGVEITYFPLRTRVGSVARGLNTTLRKTVVTYDVLHLHGIYQYFTFAGARAGRGQGIPYIITPRGMLDPFAIKRKGSLKKRIFIELVGRHDLNRAAGIHYTADEEKQLVERFGFRTPGFVVPNGINPSEYNEPCRPIHLLDKYPQLAKKQIILYLGRLDPKKGLELLIEAFARLAGSQPNLHLLVVGPDQTPYARSLKNKVLANGLKNRVDFTGFLTGDDKLWAFYLAKMFILPSYSENFGMALVEALCCGKPVITTKRVNIASDVIEYEAGLVTDCDVSQITNAIAHLLDHPDKAIALGKQGKKLVEDRFRWDKVAHDLIEVYEDILSGQKKSPAWRMGN
jgi:glycosyltransferase involved in cell wall biosynthesis